MKLLGWMHRKFRQNNGVDPFKDFALGNSCNCLSGRPSLHEQQQNHQHFLPKRPSKDQRHHFRNSFAGLDDANAAAQDDDDHHPFEEDELFQGLLAIGTLGSDPSLGAADHHRASVETITEKDTDVTPDELKLINEELEKVLGMEVKDVVKEVKEDSADVSSGRNSHVAIVAVSSGKPSSVEAASAENAAAVCPLQGYLFGSPIELPEAKVAAKEHRTSLGELFQRSRMAEEGGGGRNSGGGGKWDREEKREGGGGEKSGVQLVKKMLKRRVKGTCDSVSAETKLNKILHIFHRKVHPESSTSAKKSSKSEGHDMKGNIRNDGAGDGGDRLIPDHDIIVFPERAIRKEGVRRQKCRSNPPPFALSGSDSNGNREYWIKTDADCKLRDNFSAFPHASNRTVQVASRGYTLKSGVYTFAIVNACTCECFCSPAHRVVYRLVPVRVHSGPRTETIKEKVEPDPDLGTDFLAPKPEPYTRRV